MVSVFGRRRSTNVVDARVNTGAMDGWTMAGIGGGATIGACAIGVGLAGVNTTLCAIGLGFCPPDEARMTALDEFVAVILADTEEVWTAEFAERGEAYRAATLVLHDEEQTSLCGAIPAGQGPSYCKFDETIYMDLTYFNERVPEQGAEGDFPAAYILAHEVGHHVQNVSGEFDLKFFGQLDDPEADINQLQVRLELQADCYAGVWTKRADDRFGLLEDGDIEEGVKTAEVFGDDVQQRRDSGLVNEAAFTHGSGAQRVRWFKNGYESGERAACDTWTPAFGSL